MITRMEKTLNSLERSTLRKHERTIEEGKQAFVEVGNALLAIRDGKLYRETHKSFATYCEEKWDFTDRRARQLIEGATVAKTVAEAPPLMAESGTRVPLSTEKQARQLAPLPPDEQAPAWEEAVAEAGDGQPTANQVKAVVNRRQAAKLNGDPPPKKKAKPGKKFDKPALYKEWGRTIGPLMRLLDRIGREVGEPESPSKEVILGQLDAATEEMGEWMQVRS